MLKFLASVFILFSFVSCGVDTSSSTQTAKVEDTTGTDTGTDTLTPPPLVELNPIVDANSTIPDDGTIDPNDGTTDPGDGTTVGDGGEQANSIFNVENAIYDQYACFTGDINDGYTNNKISDTNVDDRGESDIEDGVEVNSKIPSINADEEGTRVSLFYYDLLVSRDMALVHIYEDDYRISIDKGWAYNEKKIVYVMTPVRPGSEFRSCYRYDLTSITSGSYIKTKVYRYIVK